MPIHSGTSSSGGDLLDPVLFDFDGMRMETLPDGLAINLKSGIRIELLKVSGNSIYTINISGQGLLMHIFSVDVDPIELFSHVWRNDAEGFFGVVFAGNDSVRGTPGDDIIRGFGGDDYLHNSTGDDYLDGGKGRDHLAGGEGNDTYVIDDIDERIEAWDDDGVDLVLSSVNFTLGRVQENLTLTGSRKLNGTGNDEDNIIIGNAAANRLDGGNGDDVLKGGAGDDRLDGGEGRDRLLGGAGDDTLIFNGKGADVMDGGAGTDTLRASGGRASISLAHLNAGGMISGNVEILDLSGKGRHLAVVDEASIITMSGGTLRIDGTREDAVQASGEWVSLADVTIGDTLYHRFRIGDATLLVEDGVSTDNIGAPDPVFHLSNLDGTNGFRLDGGRERLYSGAAVSGAGDINGDGFADLIVGATLGEIDGEYRSGAAFVVFGGGDEFPESIDLVDLDGNDGFQISGEQSRNYLGSAVSSAGDFNGDGIGDLLVGARGAAPHGLFQAGASYLIFGTLSGFDSRLDMTSLDGSNGFQIFGEGASAASGIRGEGAGDFNGDGFADIAIGGHTGIHNAMGGYVVFGSAGDSPAQLELSSLDGTNGFEMFFKGGRSGALNITGAGDINGDGLADLLIAAPGTASDRPGANIFVLFGDNDAPGSTFNLKSINGSNGFRIFSEKDRGRSVDTVSGAGDINGDGFDDLIIRGQYNEGTAYVVFGSGQGFPATVQLSSLNGQNGFRIEGIDKYDYAASDVSGAGDINGDGIDDLVLRLTRVRIGGEENTEAVVVLFGKASGFQSSVDLELLGGDDGLVVLGLEGYSYSGKAIQAAGDVNGDGFDDLVIGDARYDSDADPFAGTSYVVFGRDFGGEMELIGTAGDDTLNGSAKAEILIGGLGNDTLNGRDGNDVLKGAGDDDRLLGGGGADQLEGGAGDDSLNGGAGSDRLEGGDSDDRLDGGPGNDVLIGGAGSDQFRFDDALVAANVDTIMDFGGAGSAVLDLIQLDDAVFAGLSVVNATTFVSNATGDASTAAQRIIYNTESGELFYDPDGSGVTDKELFAVIASDVDGLSASDFVVI